LWCLGRIPEGASLQCELLIAGGEPGSLLLLRKQTDGELFVFSDEIPLALVK
jgi:hypothetical protein